MNSSRRNPTEEQRMLASTMLSLAKNDGFQYLMARLDRQGEELLCALVDATDNPDISCEERRETVYQVAVQIKYNRMLRDAVDEIVRNGRTDEELRNLGLL